MNSKKFKLIQNFIRLCLKISNLNADYYFFNEELITTNLDHNFYAIIQVFKEFQRIKKKKNNYKVVFSKALKLYKQLKYN